MAIKGRDRKSGRAPGRFKYHQRRPEDVRARGKLGGGNYDSPLPPDIERFKPDEGDNRVRILPAPPDRAEVWKHYGFDLWVHNNIGPDNASYACARKMRGEPCPVCEEMDAASREGDREYANSLKPRRRVLVWCIDRSDKRPEPRLWDMPWTLDRDITKICDDRETGEVLFVDDPENGWDIVFERQGTGKTTTYVGVKTSRRPSPLSDDPEQMEQWLQHVTGNPLDELVIYHDYDHIKRSFEGGKPRGEDDEDEDGRGVPARRDRAGRRAAPDEDEASPSDEDEASPSDEDESPPRKPPHRSKRVSRVDPDDDDDLDEDDFDKPAGGKRTSKRVDLDEDEDDDLDEDDPPPTSRRGKGKSSAPAMVDPDDDDDEDESPPRKSPPRSKRVSRVDPDDDDDDDDYDDDDDALDDDDEDESPPRKPPHRSKRVSRVDPDDDDDDDDVPPR